MGNRKVTLVRLCKTENGWRRYPVVVGKNGRVKPGWVKVGSEDRHYPEGRYQLRTYEGSRMLYKDVGDDAADAAAEQARTKLVLLTKETAADAGIKIVEPQGRKKLTAELDAFCTATVALGAEYAAGVKRSTVEDFLEICGVRFVDELKREHVTRFQAELRRRGNSDRTIANKHNRLLSFFRFLKLDVKELAPAKVTYEEPLPEIYKDAELKALFSGIDDDRLALAFDLLLKSGMREQEAIYLTWPHVNFEQGYIRIRSNKEFNFKVKDKEARDIPLPSALLEKLAAWKESRGGKLVLGTDSGLPETKLLRHLKRVVADLSLACGECEPCIQRDECERWYLHKFRATYTTKLLRSGMDLRTVMRLTGHSDLESVMRYLTPATDDHIQDHIGKMDWMGDSKPSKRPAGAGAALPRPRSSRGQTGYSTRT